MINWPKKPKFKSDEVADALDEMEHQIAHAPPPEPKGPYRPSATLTEQLDQQIDVLTNHRTERMERRSILDAEIEDIDLSLAALKQARKAMVKEKPTAKPSHPSGAKPS